MNYFSYFSEIEDTFIRRRGKHLLLSPMDWALIEGWKERGVPLHVAIRGIEHAFDSYEAKKRKRSVKTLLYCEEEVEAQYAEWLESRVGSHEEIETSADDHDELVFSRSAVLAHLTQAQDQLAALKHSGEWAQQEEFRETLARVLKLLAEIKDDYSSAARPDSRKLEESLTGIERLLNQALRSCVPAALSGEIEDDIQQQLKPYRTHMEQSVYQQTFQNLLLKRLRDHFGVPRLSLFYL